MLPQDGGLSGRFTLQTGTNVDRLIHLTIYSGQKWSK